MSEHMNWDLHLEARARVELRPCWPGIVSLGDLLRSSIDRKPQTEIDLYLILVLTDILSARSLLI